MEHYGRPLWSYLPVGQGIYEEEQAEKAAGKATKGTTKALEGASAAQAQASEDQQKLDQYLAHLKKREEQQGKRETAAELARKFEKDTRQEIGMDNLTLDALYNYQQQLNKEQVEHLQNTVDTEQRGKVEGLEIPWKGIAFIGFVSAGIWYWRK